MRQELTGERDLTFSRWHRSLPNDALTFIDLDYCGYCNECREPLFLMELTEDHGQKKATAVTRNAAKKMNVPAFLVMYTKSVPGPGIDSANVKQVWPISTKLWNFTPDALWSFLEDFHSEHYAKAHPRITFPPVRKAVAS